MVLYKQENGQRVQLTEEEEAAVRAEWAKNDALREKEIQLSLLKEQVPNLEQRLKALENCVLNHVPLIKTKEVTDTDIELLRKCNQIRPDIEALQQEIEQMRK